MSQVLNHKTLHYYFYFSLIDRYEKDRVLSTFLFGPQNKNKTCLRGFHTRATEERYIRICRGERESGIKKNVLRIAVWYHAAWKFYPTLTQIIESFARH